MFARYSNIHLLHGTTCPKWKPFQISVLSSESNLTEPNVTKKTLSRTISAKYKREAGPKSYIFGLFPFHVVDLNMTNSLSPLWLYDTPFLLTIPSVSILTLTHFQHGFAHAALIISRWIKEVFFLLRFNDVFQPSVSIIQTQNRELAQWLAFWMGESHLHTHTPTRYSKALTLIWQSEYTSGKVMSPTLLTWTSHPLFWLSHPLCVFCKKNMHVRRLSGHINRTGDRGDGQGHDGKSVTWKNW